MAKNGRLTIDTAINTSGIEQGMRKVQRSLNAVKGAATFQAVATAVKKTTEVITECTDALNKQVKAEKQLEAAAKNNPYLDKNSVTQLKEYASQLQSISTVGDEQLLPLMAQLATSGRTQTEIQQILNASLDMSASGVMSLESAVETLNKTYSGNVGLLARDYAELKNLTDEELRNGKAVEVLGQKFAGMNDEVTKAVGSYEQMKNAQGDFNEALGTITKPTSDLWNNFWKGWYEKGIESINKLEANLNAKTIGKKLAGEMAKGIADLNGDFKGQTRYLRDSLNMITDDELNAVDIYLSKIKNLSPEQEKIVTQLEKEKERRADLIVINNDMAKQREERIKAEKKAAEEETKRQAKEKTRQNYIDEYNNSLDDSIKKMELEAELKGEEVTEQDRLNAMLSAYFTLISNIGEEDIFSQEELEKLKKYAAGIQTVTDKFDDFKKSVDIAADYFKQAHQITQDTTELILQSMNTDTQNQLTNLSEEYAEGLLSYEEYCDKKAEITKKAADEEYKIKMWEWTSSLAAATANIAQGITTALAENVPTALKMVNAGLIATSGAIQIASITANKPQKYQNGGIVSGNSYTGDHISARLNSGEMVLNQIQQANLWKAANNGNGAGGGITMPVTINNNTSAKVSTQYNKRGLIVLIDDVVNSSMKQGHYNNAMATVQNDANGATYL